MACSCLWLGVLILTCDASPSLAPLTSPQDLLFHLMMMRTMFAYLVFPALAESTSCARQPEEEPPTGPNAIGNSTHQKASLAACQGAACTTCDLENLVGDEPLRMQNSDLSQQVLLLGVLVYMLLRIVEINVKSPDGNYLTHNHLVEGLHQSLLLGLA